MNRKGTLKHHKKHAMDVIFNAKNSQLFTWSSPSEEILSVNGKNRPVASLPVVDFRSQPREMPLPKLLNTYLKVFLSVFWFSFPSREV